MSLGYLVLAWSAAGAMIGALASGATRRLLTSPGGRAATRTSGALLTALAYAYLAWCLRDEFDLLLYSLLATIAVPLAITDAIEQRLPNVLVLPSLFVFAAFLALSAAVYPAWPDFGRALAGMTALATFYLLLALLSNGGLGAGDVKLGALLGLALAWLSWPALLVGTLAGWVLAAVTRVGQHLSSRTTLESTMALGPFLLVGAIASLGMHGPT